MPNRKTLKYLSFDTTNIAEILSFYAIYFCHVMHTASLSLNTYYNSNGF